MNLGKRNDTVSVSDGEVRAWIDGGIHLKAMTADGDPVELSAEEAREIIDGLLRLSPHWKPENMVFQRTVILPRFARADARR